MESQPQNPEFRNDPENFHPCIRIFSPAALRKVKYGHSEHSTRVDS